MENKELEQAAKEFLAKSSPNYEYQGKNWEYVKNYTFTDVLGFTQSLLDTGKLMTDKDHTRYLDEHKAEINTSALCCAVADVEQAYDLKISILEADNAQMQELISLQRKRIEQLEGSNTPQSGEVKSKIECLYDVKFHGNHSERLFEAMEMFANQFKTPAYDLLLASYNNLKEQNNKLAMENNRLMSGQKVVTDQDIVDKAFELEKEWSESGEMLKSTLRLQFCKIGQWVRDQLNKQ
uniref:Uncharacterized protein n=1 Tax=Tanacetum cinerariifolium TaxID=118510 RepID=A0A699IKR4_TANCI|nr:hypothetical protein [Tanacetum cinerariifolium]